jgi:tRNA(fMet)-specific endonuclease VapC
MAVVLDTSEVIEMERESILRVEVVLDRLPAGAQLPAIVLLELLHGALVKPEGLRRRVSLRFYEELVASCEVIPFGRAEAEMAAKVGVELRRAGTPIGGADLQIAATALVHGHTVATRNGREFGRVPGLTVHSLA